MYPLLRGMTVIEGAAFIAGPSCSLYLAQLGAHVIRFDAIGGGPDSVRWPLAENGASFYWDGLNKCKKSIAIALDRPEGRALAQRLATSADGLFVTNYPVDGFLSYQKLASLRTDLICLRVMGWADGTPAVDYTVNAAVGVPYMTGGLADDSRPVNHVLPAWDLIAGAYGAFALLAAERERRESGIGRELRVSLADVAAASLGHLGQVAEVLNSGRDRVRGGNELFGAFGRDFVIHGGERLMIVAITSRQWTSLIKVLGLEQSVAVLEAQMRISFADEGVRYTNRAPLFALVEEAVGNRSLGDLSSAFDAAGVCWSRYQGLAEAVSSDARLFTANPIFSTVTHPGTGRYLTPGAPIRIPEVPREQPRAAPRIGEHTDEVLAECLGMSENEIGHLHDQGIVG